MIYPVTTYVYLDDTAHSGSFQEPSANSTVISHLSNEQIHLNNKNQGTAIHTNNSSPRGNVPSSHGSAVSLSKSLHRVNLSSTSPHETSTNKSSQKVNLSTDSDHDNEQSSYSVGHISHLPRPSPSRTTYTIPSIINKSIGIGTGIENGTALHEEEDLFGMIKLKENDVCYTSGTIEWVGKKRSFPINSGFKIINDSQLGNEPLTKRYKNMNKTYTHGVDKINECDCADVLPTVNAIVDHLNALHEAVDLVDLRINTLEDVLSKDKTIH